jgi:hypothetical protein
MIRIPNVGASKRNLIAKDLYREPEYQRKIICNC